MLCEHAIGCLLRLPRRTRTQLAETQHRATAPSEHDATAPSEHATAPLLTLSEDALQTVADLLDEKAFGRLAATCHALHSNLSGDLAKLNQSPSVRELCRKTKRPLASLCRNDITIGSRQIEPADCSALAHIMRGRALGRLKSLVLCSNPVGDAGVSAIAAALSGAPRLSVVVFAECNVGCEGMAALAAALCRGALPKLTKLSLRSNRVGDRGAAALADAVARGSARDAAFGDGAPLQALRTLDLHDNRIGEAGLVALAAALARRGAVPALQSLLVARNPGWQGEQLVHAGSGLVDRHGFDVGAARLVRVVTH